MHADLNELLTFERVVREGSFTAAAEALGVAKSTVSQRISRLEARLGVRLLQRTSRSMSPTEDGRAYYAACARVVQEAKDADLTITAARTSPRGRLRITAPRLLGYTVLTPVVTEFLATHSEVTVDVVLAERVVDLIEEGFDLALRVGRPADSSSILRSLGQATMTWVVSPAYIERRGAPDGPDALAAHDTIGVTRGPPPTWPFFGPQGSQEVRVRGRLTVNSLVMARDAALAGAGIAFLPAFLVADDLQSGRLVSVMDHLAPPPLPLSAMYPSNRHLSARVRAFLDLLVARTTGGVPWSAPRL